MTDWTEIQGDFPINEHFIWLNNCGTTSCPIQVRRHVARLIEVYAEKGVLQDEYPLYEVREGIRGILAGLLNCEPKEIALIHNTNEGMMFLSGGLKLEGGDEILLLENEYPSNVYPWERWKDKGAIIRFIPLEKSLGEQLRAIERAVSDRTRVVSLSAVHWCTGMPMPLEETGSLCREKDIWFFVDAAQGAGHIPLDFRRIRADAMCFSAWKWLLGPLGLGVMVLDESSAERLAFPFKGCDSVEQAHQYLPYKTGLKKGAARYMTSTAPYMEWVYFHESLKYLRAIGFDNAMSRILELSGVLSRGLEKLGFETASGRFQGARTGIISARRPDVSARDLVKALEDDKIIAKERLGYLRLAPHIYESEEQMERALSVLARAVSNA